MAEESNHANDTDNLPLFAPIMPATGATEAAAVELRDLEEQAVSVLEMFEGRLSHRRLLNNMGDPRRPGCLVPTVDVHDALRRLVAAGRIASDRRHVWLL